MGRKSAYVKYEPQLPAKEWRKPAAPAFVGSRVPTDATLLRARHRRALDKPADHIPEDLDELGEIAQRLQERAQQEQKVKEAALRHQMKHQTAPETKQGSSADVIHDLAEAGGGQGLFTVALMYLDGLNGVSQDPARGEQYLRRAIAEVMQVRVPLPVFRQGHSTGALSSYSPKHMLEP